MESYNSICNICNTQLFNSVSNVVDHTVSRETFSIRECDNCKFRVTQFQTEKPLSYFYESSDYISHTDSKTGFFNNLYQIVRNYTLRSKMNLVNSFGIVEKIFDYGCGTGHFLAYAKKGLNVEVFGLEPSTGARGIAIKSGINVYENEKSFREAVPRETFSAITLWHVLEHLPKLNESIEFLKSYMNKQSTLFIAVPNHTSYDAQYYKEFWAAYDVPIHLYHFSPSSIQMLMEKHGLELIKTKPMWFDAFYVSMLSDKYKSGKIKYLKAFYIGFVSNLKALFKPGTCSSQIYIFKLKS